MTNSDWKKSTLVQGTNLLSTSLGGEEVILDLDAGIYYSLNAVGRSAWAKLKHPHSWNQLLQKMLDDFDVDELTLEKDLSVFCGELVQKGLVEVR